MRTPYYIAYPHIFRENAHCLSKAVLCSYPNYKLAYSFKTNYCSSFLNEARENGLFAEVVSDEEYELAIRNGFPHKDIIWNGILPSPYKKATALENGAIVNFDNLNELKEVYSLLERKDCKFGIRFSFPLSQLRRSRFGIEIGSAEYNQLCSYIQTNNISLYSVHCHISYARELKHFKQRIDIMADVCKKFNASVLDIGGNMYGPMTKEFAEQYGSPIPTLIEYGNTIGSAMSSHFPNNDVTLITENGTALVGNAMDLFCSVVKIDTSSITVDCKFTDVGFSCNNKNPHITILGREQSQTLDKTMTVYGCTCLERDIIHRKFLYDSSVGDILQIHGVGAYSYNVSNNFISPIPTIISQ